MITESNIKIVKTSYSQSHW